MKVFCFLFLNLAILGAAVSDGTKARPVLREETSQTSASRGIPEGKKIDRDRKKPRGIISRGPLVFVPIQVIEEETSSILKLTSSFKFRPYRGKRGKVEGYELHSVVQGGFVSLLGFQNKDVILSINRRKIRSASDIYKTFRRIKKSLQTSARVQFLRSGKKRMLRIMREEEKND